MMCKVFTHLREGTAPVTRVQLVVPDVDHARFVRQARREGMSLSAWLRSAAHDRLERATASSRIRTPEDLAAFFARCDALPGPVVEPDWEEHLAVMEQSRRRGRAPT